MSTHIPTTKELCRLLRRHRWTVTHRKKHYKALSPEGLYMFTFSKSPSDVRAIRRSLGYFQAWQKSVEEQGR